MAEEKKEQEAPKKEASVKKVKEEKKDKPAEKKVSKIWTNDHTKLVSVEKTKESLQQLDEKGELKGGREFYGVPVESK